MRRKNRDNIQYTWYFSAEPKRNFDTDVQNKVIAKGRKLSIYNIQRSGTGRYMCEITNDKGVSRTVAQFVSVWRPGRIKEMMGGPEMDIPLGRFEWEDTNKSYDKQKPPTRPFMNYDLEQEKWVRLRYNPETSDFESADAVSPGRAVINDLGTLIKRYNGLKRIQCQEIQYLQTNRENKVIGEYLEQIQYIGQIQIMYIDFYLHNSKALTNLKEAVD